MAITWLTKDNFALLHGPLMYECIITVMSGQVCHLVQGINAIIYYIYISHLVDYDVYLSLVT